MGEKTKGTGATNTRSTTVFDVGAGQTQPMLDLQQQLVEEDENISGATIERTPGRSDKKVA
jgi:hypothetical protein